MKVTIKQINLTITDDLSKHNFLKSPFNFFLRSTTMAKAIVEQNQALLDKVIHDNEKLLLTRGKLKQELADLQKALANCKTETLQSLEPEIENLLKQHKANLENQKANFEQQLLINPYENEAQIIHIQTHKKITKMNEDCKNRLQDIKNNAIQHEAKMKEDFQHIISQIPSQIQDEIKKLKEKLETERPKWQENRTEQLRIEFQKKKTQIAKNRAEKQENYYKEMINKLKNDAGVENLQLKQKLEMSVQDHRKKEKELTSEIALKKERITQIRTIHKEKENELNELKLKVNRCQCEKFQNQIEEFHQKLSLMKQQLQSEKEKQIMNNENNEKEKLQFETQIATIRSENQILQNQIREIQSEIDVEKQNSNQKIHELEEKQKSELSLIAERVKQTVAKKDEIIQNLMDRLIAFNETPDF